MIIFDDGFLTEFYNGRMCAVEGKVGSGKTLLTLDIAKPLLDKGYHFISNMSCVWNDDPYDVPNGEGCVVDVDEGGTYLRSGESVNNFSRFLRKIDYFLLMPCRKLPHEELCELTVSPWFDFYKNFAIPIKVWRYDVSSGKRQFSGKLFQTNWQGLYGVYSSIDPGDYPEILMDFVYERTKELFEQYQRRLTLHDVAVKSKSSGTYNDIEYARELASTTKKLTESLSMVEGKTTQRRRR